MAKRGRPPKTAQTLVATANNTTTTATVSNGADSVLGVSAGEIQEQATGEPVSIIVPTASAPITTTKKSLGVRKLKISVYAIAKNESKFVQRWYDSMKEADEICVLDTGSTDDTVKQLTLLGVKVKAQTISPWRFDVARNESLKLVSDDADILVCTDLDEFFISGWRAKLEAAWLKALDEGLDPTTATYEYVWNFNPDGSDGLKFNYEKIHAKKCDAKWTHPVHEILSYPCQIVPIHVTGMRLEHHADNNKSRSQYLSLLEMSVKECPDDDRNMHYLGREYMLRGMYDKAIETLTKHLAMPKAVWKAERAASMRFIARSYGAKRDYINQKLWLLRAICEDLDQREACIELAEVAYKNKDWLLLVQACEICISRKRRVMCYITEPLGWSERPYDLYSIGLWWLGRRKESLYAVEHAISINPRDKRLLSNRELIVKEMARRGELKIVDGFGNNQKNDTIKR